MSTKLENKILKQCGSKWAKLLGTRLYYLLIQKVFHFPLQLKKYNRDNFRRENDFILNHLKRSITICIACGDEEGRVID